MPATHETAMVDVPGGTYVMGEASALAHPGDGDFPIEVHVEPFRLDARAVTNGDFARFVDATGHRTDAERFGWSFVLSGLLPDDYPDTRGVVGAEWWRKVVGADWRHPEGPHSTVVGLETHPVVHVSWNDAMAYAAWRDARLPTEVEWERAARAGTETIWPWGDELEAGGRHHMNVWQGTFPHHNTVADGWYGTCPVDAFEPNQWGLSNMVGNVWEWTEDRCEDQCARRGGSYLCHASYCRRYRPSGRTVASPDSSAGNVGFRCAR